MTKTTYLLLATIALWAQNLFCQQAPRYSLYSFAPTTISAAHTGELSGLVVTSAYRSQWEGVDGAPRTFFLAGEQQFGEGHGLGLNIVNDRLGPTQFTEIRLNYAYEVKLRRSLQLRLGLNASGNFFDFDSNALNVADTETQLMESITAFDPNFGIGALLQGERWYLGLSLPTLLENQADGGSEEVALASTLQFYATAGIQFPLGQDWGLKGAVLYGRNGLDGDFTDLSATFKYRGILWFAPSYRLDIGFGGLVGFQISQQLGLAYAYDRDTTTVGNFSNGSHEIAIRFKFNNGFRESDLITRN